MTVRLDKYLANLWIVPRRQVGRFIKQWVITVNGALTTESDQKINFWDRIGFGEQEIEVKQDVTILLYKPAGYVCSDLDENYPSYRRLLADCPYVNTLHVAGRLDRDTEGLVVASSNGQFIHEIISPKKKLEKEYYVEMMELLKDWSIETLKNGVVLDDGYKTLPAKVEKVSDRAIRLTIVEGKFHQVKRMLEAVGNKVTYLRRERVGERRLEGLEKGKREYC